jgi:hypothetical protein
MISLPAGTRIWLAAGVTDMRCYAELPVMRRRDEFLSHKLERSLFRELDYFA